MTVVKSSPELNNYILEQERRDFDYTEENKQFLDYIHSRKLRIIRASYLTLSEFGLDILEFLKTCGPCVDDWGVAPVTQCPNYDRFVELVTTPKKKREFKYMSDSLVLLKCTPEEDYELLAVRCPLLSAAWLYPFSTGKNNLELIHTILEVTHTDPPINQILGFSSEWFAVTGEEPLTFYDDKYHISQMVLIHEVAGLEEDLELLNLPQGIPYPYKLSPADLISLRADSPLLSYIPREKYCITDKGQVDLCSCCSLDRSGFYLVNYCNSSSLMVAGFSVVDRKQYLFIDGVARGILLDGTWELPDLYSSWLRYASENKVALQIKLDFDNETYTAATIPVLLRLGFKIKAVRYTCYDSRKFKARGKK